MKLRFLDGLRGWAALIVVLNHYIFALLPFAINEGGQYHNANELLIHNSPLYLFVDGDFSVCIFFILSGIVLSASFFRLGNRIEIVGSIIKRYFRLALPAGGSVLLAYVLLKTGHLHNQQAAALSGSPWWNAFWQFPPHFLTALQQGFWQILTSDTDTYNPVLWTMKLEFIGSILIFCALAAFGRLPRRWFIYAVLVLLLWKTYYVDFVFGLVFSDIYFHELAQRTRAILGCWVWMPLLAAGLLLGSVPYGPLRDTMFAGISSWLPAYQLQTTVHSLGALLVMVAVMTSSQLQRGLAGKLSLFMGRISFALYLTHFLVPGSYTGYLFIALRHSFGYRSSILLAFAPSLVVSICVAFLYAVSVDEPSTRFAGWIKDRIAGIKMLRLPARRPVVAERDPSPEVAHSATT